MGIETKVEDAKQKEHEEFYKAKTGVKSEDSQRYAIKKAEQQAVQYRNTRIY